MGSVIPAARPADAALIEAKRALRTRLLRARADLDPAARTEAGAALRDRVLAVPEFRAARVVAGYVSVGTEPATDRLLDSWHSAGITVLLPILLDDGDLDWSAYEGPGTLRSARLGLRQPVGPRLGVAAVASAEAVLVPALAVDRAGRRLGRGGGSYDRALGRVPPGRFSAALLYDHEVVAAVPAGPLDRPVAAAVTPTRLLRLR